jgi:hypothetical protein
MNFFFHASQLRNEIHASGAKTFMPNHDVIDNCVHKYKTYLRCKEAGIIVPENQIINSEDDLKKAFADLGDEKGNIWLRASSIGGVPPQRLAHDEIFSQCRSACDCSTVYDGKIIFGIMMNFKKAADEKNFNCRCRRRSF